MATGGTHLLGGRLNLTLVREAARAELKEILGDSSVQKVTLLFVQLAETSRQLTSHSPYR